MPPPGARRHPRSPHHAGGYDWTKRYPWITEATRKVRQKRFVLDGEAVILGVDGISDFNALHSGKHDDEVQLCAFDILPAAALPAAAETAADPMFELIDTHRTAQVAHLAALKKQAHLERTRQAERGHGTVDRYIRLGKEASISNGHRRR